MVKNSAEIQSDPNQSKLSHETKPFPSTIETETYHVGSNVEVICLSRATV